MAAYFAIPADRKDQVYHPWGYSQMSAPSSRTREPASLRRWELESRKIVLNSSAGIGWWQTSKV